MSVKKSWLKLVQQQGARPLPWPYKPGGYSPFIRRNPAFLGVPENSPPASVESQWEGYMGEEELRFPYSRKAQSTSVSDWRVRSVLWQIQKRRRGLQDLRWCELTSSNRNTTKLSNHRLGMEYTARDDVYGGGQDATEWPAWMETCPIKSYGEVMNMVHGRKQAAALEDSKVYDSNI